MSSIILEKFISDDTFHEITILLFQRIAYFRIINFDVDYIDSFSILFKKCTDYLAKTNINTIQQEIVSDEFKLFKYIKLNIQNIGNITFKLFISVDKYHEISIIILSDEAYFKIIEFDFDYPKTFLLLLKECSEYLTVNNIKTVKQEIINDEFKLFKYSKKYDNLYEDQIMIETKYENFITEIYGVFDLDMSVK